MRRVVLGALLAMGLGAASIALALLMASPGSSGGVQILALLFLSLGAVLLVFGVGGFLAGVVAYLRRR